MLFCTVAGATPTDWILAKIRNVSILPGPEAIHVHDLIGVPAAKQSTQLMQGHACMRPGRGSDSSVEQTLCSHCTAGPLWRSAESNHIKEQQQRGVAIQAGSG
jgi:hypothetical protein